MSVIDAEFAAKCIKVHKQAAENWSDGKIVKVWKDKNNILCITYESGRWWHYQQTGSGSIEWW